MMAILYSKMHNIKKNKGKEAARGESDITHCPNCGNEAKLIEKHRDRATYKCTKCNAINTFTRPPTDYERKQTIKPNQSLIVIRDRSKEKKEDKKEDVKETKETDAPKKEEKGPEKSTDDIPKYTVDTIRKSLQHAKVMNFKYLDRNGNKSTRNVEPYKIMKQSNGDIILYAYCLDSEGIRTFKINRIRKIKQLSYQFKPRWPLEDKLGSK